MPRDDKSDPFALRIALLYALLSAIWILVSDQVVLALIHDPRQVALVETYKGWGFVLVTAVLLYVLQRHQFGRAAKVEAERGREAARLADILQIVAQAIIAVDRKGRILVFNQAAEETFGYRSEEILGRPLDLLLPAPYPRVVRTLIASLADGSSPPPPSLKGQEISARRRNGQPFEAEASISRLEQEGLTLFAIALSDVSERKRAEQALRLSEGQYRGFLEHVPLGVYRSDPQGQLLVANSALAQMLGFETENDLLALNLGRDLYADLRSGSVGCTNSMRKASCAVPRCACAEGMEKKSSWWSTPEPFATKRAAFCTTRGPSPTSPTESARRSGCVS